MGEVEVGELLANLAMQGEVAASTRNQALNVPIFFWPDSGDPHVRSKRLVALAVTSLERSPAASELSTFKALGYPLVEAPSWYSIVAPAATPRDLIDRLHDELARISAMPDYREPLGRQGFEPQASTPGQFAACLKGEYDKWGNVIRG